MQLGSPIYGCYYMLSLLHVSRTLPWASYIVIIKTIQGESHLLQWHPQTLNWIGVSLTIQLNMGWIHNIVLITLSVMCSIRGWDSFLFNWIWRCVTRVDDICFESFGLLLCGPMVEHLRPIMWNEGNSWTEIGFVGKSLATVGMEFFSWTSSFTLLNMHT